MALVRLSFRAQADLRSIARYTHRVWGDAQTVRYVTGIRYCCQHLADNPLQGRPCNHLHPDLRRSEHGKHVIFYHQDANGILVSRILHHGMLPEGHTLEDPQ